MMKRLPKLSRSIFLVGVTAGAMSTSSCYWLYPYQESVPPPAPPTQPQTLDQLKEQQEEQENAPDESERIPENLGDPDPAPIRPPAPKPAEPSTIPVAKSVPGRDGFVFSPFNNKLIDVKGFPSGATVADPSYPKEAKKYFKVP